MKNNYSWRIVLLLILLSIVTACKNKNTGQIYFSINPENRSIEIPVQLNDTVTANMVFDTGWGDGRSIYIDSSFVASHPCLIPDVIPDTTRIGSSWKDYMVSNLAYKKLQTVKIGNINMEYNTLQISDWKGYMQTYTDGIFNIPASDSTHVWELNFEHNYMKIHHSKNFKMPKNCFLCTMERKRFHIKLSMEMKCANGDTLTINDICFIDTGMANDIALVHPNQDELEFFDKAGNAVWTGNPNGGYTKRYTVRATLFDDFVIDSLRIYTYSNISRVNSKILIGLNFLKRFNVFLDMKNSQAGLQPVKNFQRVVNPNHRRYYFSLNTTKEGKVIVTNVADYKGNYYMEAGLQKNDEIVTINGKFFKALTFQEKLTFDTVDTFIYGIIRNGKPLELVIPVDKNEEKGD
jgi:hypothetical protein